MLRLLQTCLISVLLVLGPLRAIAPCWVIDGCAGGACEEVDDGDPESDCSTCCGSPVDQDEDQDEDTEDRATADGEDVLCPCCELPLVYVHPPLAPTIVEHVTWAVEDPVADLEGTEPTPLVPPPIRERA